MHRQSTVVLIVANVSIGNDAYKNCKSVILWEC